MIKLAIKSIHVDTAIMQAPQVCCPEMIIYTNISLNTLTNDIIITGSANTQGYFKLYFLPAIYGYIINEA